MCHHTAVCTTPASHQQHAPGPSPSQHALYGRREPQGQAKLHCSSVSYGRPWLWRLHTLPCQLVLLFGLLCDAALLLASRLYAAEPPDPYPNHCELLYFVDDAGQFHPVRTPDEWAIRRAHILLGMQAVMGSLPPLSEAAPPKMEVLGEEEIDGVRMQRIVYDSIQTRVPALLLLPPAGTRPEIAAGVRRPAMLALHSTGARGKEIVLGAAEGANRSYGLELAQRGYVVLAPDYPSFGDLSGHDFATDAYESGTMLAIVNHMRGVDLLSSREDVDPERIGVIGHSLGGHNAMFVGAFDERLKVVVSSCGWCPFHDYYGGRLAGWAQDRYMPAIRERFALDPDRMPFDFYEVAAALAPRAFFSNSPVHDDNFSVEGVRKAEVQVRKVYELLGAAEALKIEYPDCGHDFPPELRQAAYELIDRVLGHGAKE